MAPPCWHFICTTSSQANGDILQQSVNFMPFLFLLPHPPPPFSSGGGGEVGGGGSPLSLDTTNFDKAISLKA